MIVFGDCPGYMLRPIFLEVSLIFDHGIRYIKTYSDFTEMSGTCLCTQVSWWSCVISHEHNIAKYSNVGVHVKEKKCQGKLKCLSFVLAVLHV